MFLKKMHDKRINKTYLSIARGYRDKNGKAKSTTVQTLGSLEKLQQEHDDPIAWAKEYLKELNTKEKENAIPVLVKYQPQKQIEKDRQNSFNGGYLFLQKLYHQLELNNICDKITDKYKFDFDLNSILSRLIYGRFLNPSSKLSTYEFSKTLLEQPNFELHQIYRALEIIAKETDFIQSELYKNSLKISDRNSRILYYDCTNYFFEIEEQEGLKQYGHSKENRPNPIVQMGLFMDGDGIPLAFSITSGNTNEQITLKPLEEKILKDFSLSKIVVCTDAGLAGAANRKFNDTLSRSFITTQSIKKLKTFLRDWSLEKTGWHLANDKKAYDISQLDDIIHYDKIFFKERWIKENGLEQKLVVTFSLKYKNYQEKIRRAQIERAAKIIANSPDKLSKTNQNDFRRFIKKTSVTREGEIASKQLYSIDNSIIKKESQYDGFYGVCTNLEDDTNSIIEVNKRRWEIEECFRIMKSEFKARPVYLKRDDRITAHFTTCFLSLILHRFLEKQLGVEKQPKKEKFTASQIIDTLRDMNFQEITGKGYLPSYMRTKLTDVLHEKFNFRTDYEILTHSAMKKIFKQTKI